MRFSIRRLLCVTALVAVCLPLALWLIPSFLAKGQYESSRTMLYKELGQPFSIKPIDQDIGKKLGLIQSSWTCTSEEISGPHTEALRLTGITPNVDGIIQLYNFRMQEFSWFDSGHNRNNLVIGLVQATIVPTSIDNTIYVSEDGRLAVLFVTKRSGIPQKKLTVVRFN